jgi:TonB family protein
MNRLQKKCVIATAGIHLLLLTILIVGPAFFNPKSKPDDSQVLDVIPANLIDAAFNSGVKNAQPPAPAPVVQPQPQPVQLTPKPIVAPAPTPTFAQRVEKFFTERKPDLTLIEKSPSPKKIDLTPVVRTVPKNSTTPNQQDNSRQQQQRQKAFQNAVKNLKNNFTPSKEINLSGNSSAAYANYGNVVTSVYHNAWTPPDGMSSDNVTVQFKVTIANDGTVINAQITSSSGDSNIDSAVQRMLSRVSFIAPFPDGVTEKERSYTINFNATRESIE